MIPWDHFKWGKVQAYQKWFSIIKQLLPLSEGDIPPRTILPVSGEQIIRSPSLKGNNSIKSYCNCLNCITFALRFDIILTHIPSVSCICCVFSSTLQTWFFQRPKHYEPRSSLIWVHIVCNIGYRWENRTGGKRVILKACVCICMFFLGQCLFPIFSSFLAILPQVRLDWSVVCR